MCIYNSSLTLRTCRLYLPFRELKLVKSMISETAFIFEFHDLLIPTRRNSKKIELPV